MAATLARHDGSISDEKKPSASDAFEVAMLMMKNAAAKQQHKRKNEHALLSLLRTRMPAKAVAAERHDDDKAAVQQEKTLDYIVDVALDRVHTHLELKEDTATTTTTAAATVDATSTNGTHSSGSGSGKQPFVSMVSPMVRYSKLPFRLLCRRWGADIAFTPMIIAEGFNRSQRARDSEYVSSYGDAPLVAQFGTNSPMELSLAAEKVASYAQAIDLNCGCPQKWATKDGIGAALSRKPDLVREMVAATRARVGDMPCSIKIRVLPDLRQTVELVRRAENVGVSWITVHGRTPEQRRQPANHDSIGVVKDAARVPIIANGDIFTPQDVTNILSRARVDGFMSARGALANPALFGGYATVPMECVTDYLQLALQYGGNYNHHHHHILYMLFAHLSRADRREFTLLRSMAAIIDFFERRCWWPPVGGEETLLKLPPLIPFPSLATTAASRATTAPTTAATTRSDDSTSSTVPLYDAAAATSTSSIVTSPGSNDNTTNGDESVSLADPTRIYKGRIR